MQIHIRIGAGAILVAALLAVLAWTLREHWWPGGAGAASPAVPGTSTAAPAYITTNGGTLAIAWVKSYETFERRSPSELEIGLWKLPMPFGETVSEIATAAKYQYQIRLDRRWPIRCTKTECVVRTGPVELAEPVAIYHEETRRKTRSGWARFDKAENLEALNQSLGRALVQRGNLPRNRDLGLRNGRAEVEKFVRAWMLREGYGDRRIVVLYPGEELVDGQPASTQ